MEVSSAPLRGILRTFSIASLTKRGLNPFFIRSFEGAPARVLRNSSVGQILLSRKAMLKGMDCLV